MTDITLITCTGDRPEAFALCEKYMARQSHKAFQWIVIDDGIDPVTVTMDQQHLRLPQADTPVESFRRNLCVAFEMVATDKIVFIEDDDAYHSRFYLDVMRSYLDKFELVGEAHTRYYHVKHRRWKIHPNATHASLCQTGIRKGKRLNALKTYIRDSARPQQADGTVWKRLAVPDNEKHLIPTSSMVLAIKGVPGRGGLGIHHSHKELEAEGYEFDRSGTLLKQWLGDEDAAPYLEWYEPEDMDAAGHNSGDVLQPPEDRGGGEQREPAGSAAAE